MYPSRMLGNLTQRLNAMTATATLTVTVTTTPAPTITHTNPTNNDDDGRGGDYYCRETPHVNHNYAQL